MAKFKTIKDNINVYDKDKGIVRTLPAGTTVDIKSNEYTNLYGKAIIYGFISDAEYIITEWNGVPSVEKIQIKKTKKEANKDE